MKLNIGYLLPILLILIGVQISATMLSIPVKATNVTAFGDPESTSNPFIYLVMVIVMTGIILFLFKFKGIFKKFIRVIIKAFFIITVWATVLFVTQTIVLRLYGDTNPAASYIALLIPVVAAVLIWKYPEWYVIDTIGFIVCVGVTTIIGVSFGIYPVIILLVIFAIYDAIAVYKTRHMITLAEGVLDQKLPALFIVPKEKGFSYIKSKPWKDLDDTKRRQAYIIGMGDIVFPSAMVVSASVFIVGTKIFGIFTIPAIGAMIGSLLGMIALQEFASRYPQSHAGLPLLNSFTIVGFLIMYGISMVAGV
jgi:presenilin-like A22 family membrane protease